MQVNRSPSEWLPETLRAKQRECVRHHNQAVFGLVAVVFLTILGFLFLQPKGFHLRIGWLAAAVLIEAVPGFVLIKRRDDRRCREIGFVCPACGKPLYYASDRYAQSRLLTHGECPHCHGRVVPVGLTPEV